MCQLENEVDKPVLSKLLSILCFQVRKKRSLVKFRTMVLGNYEAAKFELLNPPIIVCYYDLNSFIHSKSISVVENVPRGRVPDVHEKDKSFDS